MTNKAIERSTIFRTVNHLFLWAIYTMALLVIARGYYYWRLAILGAVDNKGKSYHWEMSPGYESPSGAVCYHGLPHTDYSRLGQVQPLIWELGAPKSWSFPIFSMIFLSFPWFSYIFSMIFPSFPWFSYIFSMIFPYIFHYFPKCFLSFLIFSYGISTRPSRFFFFGFPRGHAEACSIQLDDVRGGRAQSQVGRWGYSHPVGRFLWENHSYIISRFYGNIIINNRKNMDYHGFFG